METILLIATFLALFGAYLNAKGNSYGFGIWLVTNSIFATHNLLIGQWQQGLLFLAYFFLSTIGIVNHLKKPKM